MMSTPVPLLATKLHTPPTLAALISRHRLLEKLNDGLRLGLRVTLLSAPAGYGKTTLLSDWARHCDRAVAWLSLDEDDNDPARFLAYLTAALNRIDVAAPAFGGDAVSAGLASLQPFAAQDALLPLINAVESTGGEFVLVLDDYHLIQAAPVHDALAYLLDHQPPQMHLVIASRADPPVPLARLRARGQLVELRQGDLRFTLGETTAFLNQTMGIGLAASDVAVLAARTEGWVAGLHLAATSLQARGDAHRFIQDFTGSHRYILDYLIEEVLQHQSPDLQAFLLQTSILDRLTGALCDAVTEQGGGQARLEQLERANLFIVPLDDDRRWYRYHRLFADLLQKRLGETYPQLGPALHRRASAWHEQNGWMAEAIDHALATNELERAAQLVERIAAATLTRGESATLRKWLDALPDAQVGARPLLCIFHAWLLLMGGSPLEAVEARLQLLEARPTPLALPLWALVANYRGDYARAIELSRRALEQLPETEALMRGLAVLNLAAAHHTQGDLAASQRILQEAALGSHAPENAVTTVAALCYRADLCRREGRLHQAQSLYQQALASATGQDGERLPIAGRPMIGLSEIAREWNELEAAAQYVLQGMDLARRWSQAGTLEAYLTLARVRQGQGDWDGVHEALQAMRQVALEFKATEADDRIVDLAEAWLRLLQGGGPGPALDGPRRWAERYGLSGNVDPVELEKRDDSIVRRLRKYEYPVLARLRIAEGRPAEALALLTSALPLIQQSNRIGLMIEYELLIARAAQALGQSEHAQQALERALVLAEPEGYVRIFIDEGKALAGLMYEAVSRGIHAEYAGRLLAAFPTSALPSSKPAEMIEPLSERELGVLRLIAEGLSNEEAARRLVLSLPTIKWHASNIYGKLGVKSRTEAVARARALGILRAPPA